MAQWLAQATHNRLVEGSNPSGPTFCASFKVQLTFEGKGLGIKMLKEHKNNWFSVIQQSSVALVNFEYLETQESFTIQVKNTPLKFHIVQTPGSFDSFTVNCTEFSPGFPLREKVWGRKSIHDPTSESNYRRVPITGDSVLVAHTLQTWLTKTVQRYFAEEQAPDLWKQLQTYSLFSDSSTIPKEDLEQFTIGEKKQIVSGLLEYKQYIAEKLDPTQEQLKLVEERLDYLTEAVERLNRFDWKALAASTLVSIAVTLSVDTATGRQLLNTFTQLIGAISGHLLPPGL
jgi:hypothetical protein